MPETPRTPKTLSLSFRDRLDAARRRFADAWHGGTVPLIEDELAAYPDGPERDALFRELLQVERAFRPDVPADEFAGRFPEFASLVETVFRDPPGDTPKIPPAATAAEPVPTIPGCADVRPLAGDRAGMGVLYLARHVQLDMPVVVKMIRGAARPQDLARFRVEAQAVARLTHPHIVRVYDFGACDGRPYFTMEYAEQGSLARRLAAGPLDPPEAAGLIESLARTMHFIHERQIVHRDLKPANVLFAPEPKVADFGLAKRLDAAGPTPDGQILGTLAYMAPEQASGDSARIGPAADVYALGAILYECLTGRPPFVADRFEVAIYQVLTDEPVPPRRLRADVPDDLEAIVLKCLVKDPDHRYVSALELARDLRRYLDGEPLDADTTDVVERHRHWVLSVGYEIEEVLWAGRWGFGYKVRGKHVRSRVEVLYLAIPSGPNDDPAARVRRQVESLARSAHPNVVHLNHHGEYAGRSYLLLEYLEGGSLNELFRQTQAGRALASVDRPDELAVIDVVSGGRHAPFSPQQAVEIVEALARAVQHCHERGVVHGGISPACVMFTATGVPKLGGLLAARMLDDLEASPPTADAFDWVRPNYLSPEALEGRWDAYGPAVDVYGLGALLYELLTGEPPFSAPSLSETRAWAATRAPTPPGDLADVPPALAAVCHRCLEKEPSRRYASAAVLADELRRYRDAAEFAGTTAPDLPVFGGYVATELIADRGAIRFYKAREVRGGRKVCLKVFSELVTEAHIERFRRNAWPKLTDWNHPNVLRAFGAGARGGLVYLACELVGGGTLTERVGRRPQSIAEVVRVAAAVATAVAAAHRRGLMHGNLEPSNVLFDGDTPKVTEFGLVNQPAAEGGPSGDFQFIGKVPYLAPEVIDNDEVAIGPRTDVYGLGGILYYLLTGRRPIDGDTTLATAVNVKLVEPTPPSFLRPGVPEQLATTCMRALSKDPADRYGSAEEFLIALGGDVGIEGSEGEATQDETVPPTVEPPTPAADAIPGYEILSHLASGGLARVYKARQRATGRIVALKVLAKALPGGDDQGNLLRYEAELLAGLDHPNVVRFHEVGDHAGLAFLAEEFVGGGSLYRAIRGEPQPFDAAARLMAELAEAVKYLHRRGVVHRDLKPANVLLAPEPGDPDPDRPYGVPKLTDFGLSLRAGGVSPRSATAVVGTPSYMAPEQAAGEPTVGPAVDVWSLGVILYELLTGTTPFRGATLLDVFDAVRAGTFTPPQALRPDVPEPLDAACRRCLERVADERFAAGDLAKAMRRYIDTESR